MLLPALSLSDRVRGCLVGGALGDAWGAPTEFLTLAEIRERFGPDGPARPMPAYDLPTAVTDDTQMTLFTAEGLVRAARAGASEAEVTAFVWAAYRRWMATQGEQVAAAERHGGGLVDVPGLHARRAPGGTCLSALRAPAMPPGGVAQNDSKGCGGVMRAAPAALAGHPALGLPGTPFGVGCAVAALTHGHPAGYVAAGALAHLVRLLLDGQPLATAARDTAAFVRPRDPTGETSAALAAALALFDAGAAPEPETFARLGGGFVTPHGGAWVAEEALGGALWAALTATAADASGRLPAGASEALPVRIGQALRLAATHDGDSDSTGALAGNLLGAAYGEAALPREALDGLDLVGTVRAVADALAGTDA